MEHRRWSGVLWATSTDAAGRPVLARHARGQRFESSTPHPRSPRYSVGGFVVDREIDRKAAVDGVGGVLPERVGDLLAAAQHPETLVPEHVQMTADGPPWVGEALDPMGADADVGDSRRCAVGVLGGPLGGR